MITALYPQIYIDIAVPDGWGRNFPLFEVRDSDQARNLLSKFYQVNGTFILGVDMRGADASVYNLLLKFIEDTRLQLIIRATDPIPATLISRMAHIVKKSSLEREPALKLLLGSQVIAQKVLELR